MAKNGLCVLVGITLLFSCSLAGCLASPPQQPDAGIPVVPATAPQAAGTPSLPEGTPVSPKTTQAPPAIASASPTPSDKFMVYLPWPNGERWYMTEDQPGEGAFDFANFASPKAAVLAAAGGRVLLSNHTYADDFNIYHSRTYSIPDLGNFVLLQHGPDTYTLYAHLRHEAPAPVFPGQEVPAGTRVGWQGNTGNSNGPHLHFAVVNIQIFPEPAFIPKPRSGWGFFEMNGTNSLIVNTQYESANIPAP